MEAAKELLASSRRGMLAVNGDDGYPYAIPINYLYDDEQQKIFFHSAGAGYKVESLIKSDKVCFTVYGDEMIKDEDWAPYVQSVVVFGRCCPIKDNDVAMAALKNFAMKYYPTEQMVVDEIRHAGRAVQMFEILVEHISGKQVQEK